MPDLGRLRDFARRAIRAERAHPARELREIDEGARAVQVVARNREVGVEHVLPGTPSDRTRLQLREIDTAQRERTQRAEERTGLARQREHDRRLVRSLRDRLPRDDAETRDVRVEILNAALQHVELEYLRRANRRDRRVVLQSLLANQLGPAGGVVDGLDLYVRQPAEEPLALRQRLRMRVHDTHVVDAHTRKREQAVVDLELHLTDDWQLVLDQQVVIPVDGAADGVLHRQDAPRDGAIRHRLEHVLETPAGEGCRLRVKRERRRFAVGAGLPLVRNTHPGMVPSGPLFVKQILLTPSLAEFIASLSGENGPPCRSSSPTAA